MGITFFKKFSPETKVVIAGLANVQFDTLDGIIGYYATDKDQISAGLKQMIEQNRYGMSEISEEEFHRDYAGPKKNGTRRVAPHSLWRRESLGAAGFEPGTNPGAVLHPDYVAAKVAVGSQKPASGLAMETEAPTGSASASALPAPSAKPEPPKPNTGSRKKNPERT